MNILFIAANGVYQALIAAKIHINELKTNDYTKLPHFADYQLEENGKPLFVGNDSNNNRVYILGVGPDIKMVEKCLQQLKTVLGASPGELQIVPITVNSQWVIILLHKASRIHLIRSLSIACICKLLRRDLPLIADQVQYIKKYKC